MLSAAREARVLGGDIPFLFEKLEVYQKALAFAERVSTLTEPFARGHWYLADQLTRVRAAPRTVPTEAPLR